METVQYNIFLVFSGILIGLFLILQTSISVILKIIIKVKLGIKNKKIQIMKTAGFFQIMEDPTVVTATTSYILIAGITLSFVVVVGVLIYFTIVPPTPPAGPTAPIVKPFTEAPVKPIAPVAVKPNTEVIISPQEQYKIKEIENQIKERDYTEYFTKFEEPTLKNIVEELGLDITIITVLSNLMLLGYGYISDRIINTLKDHKQDLQKHIDGTDVRNLNPTQDYRDIYTLINSIKDSVSLNMVSVTLGSIVEVVAVGYWLDIGGVTAVVETVQDGLYFFNHVKSVVIEYRRNLVSLFKEIFEEARIKVIHRTQAMSISLTYFLNYLYTIKPLWIYSVEGRNDYDWVVERFLRLMESIKDLRHTQLELYTIDVIEKYINKLKTNVYSSTIVELIKKKTK